MDSAIIILSIFLALAIGLIVFLVAQNFKAQDSSNAETYNLKLSEEVRKTIEEVFNERESQFKTSSKENIEKIIDPFKARIKEFEDEVKKNTEQQLKLHVETKTTIDGLIEKTNQITSDTANLADALRGDSKTQGDYGEMKLRMLNGTHSTLAYLGYLAGMEYVSEAVQQPVFESFLRNMMKDEIMPTLKLPESVDLDQYQNALIERYQNPALKHRLWQIAMDGSQKLPQRLLGTIRDRIATATSFNRLVLAVAGWMRYILGRDEKGNPIEVRDPLAEVYRKISLESGMLEKETPSVTSINAYVSQILSIKEIFGEDLPDNPHFRNAVTREFEKLMNQGALKSIQDLS